MTQAAIASPEAQEQAEKKVNKGSQARSNALAQLITAHKAQWDQILAAERTKLGLSPTPATTGGKKSPEQKLADARAKVAALEAEIRAASK